MRTYKITLFVKSTIKDLKEWFEKQELSIVFIEQGFLFPELRDSTSDLLKSWVEEGVNVIRLSAEGSNTIDCSNLKQALTDNLKKCGFSRAIDAHDANFVSILKMKIAIFMNFF